MSRRIWTKPFVKTILSGDQRKARSLERKARSYVGYIFDQMGDNQKYRTGNWNLKDGAKISVYCWKNSLGQRALVRIFHPEFGEAAFQYGSLWSGLASPPDEKWYILDPITELDLSAPTYWTGKTDGENWKFNTFNPKNVVIQRASDTEKPERYFPQLGYGEVGKVPYQNIEQFDNTNLIGSYTGKMRQVVQRMLGAGQVCPWRSRWENTDWIYTTSTGVDWVISVTEIFGIRAAPVVYSKIQGEEEIALGFENAEDNANWIVLAGPSEVEDYFDGSPLSFDIGWACNTDGSRARNISVTMDINQYRTTHEWEISIAESSIDGVVQPTSASMSNIQSTLAWTDIRGRLRVPNGMDLSTVVEWGDPGDSNIPPKPTGQDSFSWIIFVYFNGDAPQQYYMNYDSAPEREETAADPRGDTSDDVWMSDGIDYYPFIGSYPNHGTGTYSLGGNKSYYSRLYFTGPGAPGSYDYGYSIYDLGEDTFVLEVEGSAGGSLIAGGTPSGYGGLAGGGNVFCAVRYRKLATNGGSHTIIQGAWIPNGDRQSILFNQRTLNITQSYVGGMRRRLKHHFGTYIEVVGGIAVEGCECWVDKDHNSVVVQRVGGQSWQKNVLPSPVGNLYPGSWNYPDGICPMPWYQKPWVCNDPITDWIEDPGERTDTAYPALDEESETSQYWEISGVVSDVLSGDVILTGTEHNSLATLYFSVGITAEVNPPLYVNRSFENKGIYQALASTSSIESFGGLNNKYLEMFQQFGGPLLWVGEPHI